jgi:hypothetical protein
MIACLDLIFRHGVRHIVTSAVTQSQLHETTPGYREHLLEWLTWGLSGPEALADYTHLGWRVRLVGGWDVPELQAVAHRLNTSTLAASPHTLWWFWAPGPDRTLAWLQHIGAHQGALSQTEAVRTLYEEDIPLATLFLSYGKPILTPELLPPLLVGALQCYWRQRPGYSVTERELRLILYDYAYLRPTWRTDKTGRAKEAVAQRAAWEQAPILGLGQRLGPFWYPAPQERNGVDDEAIHPVEPGNES